jgi:hypothetical protein
MIEQNKNEDIEMNDNKTEIKERFLIDYQRKMEKLNRLYKIDSDNNYIISPNPGFVYLQEIVGETIPQTIIKPTIYDNESNNNINEQFKIKTPSNESKIHYFANKSNIKYEIIEEY